jgi:hypothetical protein
LLEHRFGSTSRQPASAGGPILSGWARPGLVTGAWALLGLEAMGKPALDVSALSQPTKKFRPRSAISGGAFLPTTAVAPASAPRLGMINGSIEGSIASAVSVTWEDDLRREW